MNVTCDNDAILGFTDTSFRSTYHSDEMMSVRRLSFRVTTKTC